MLKKHMLACLVVTAFAAPAFAQNTTMPSGSTDRPAASGSGTTTTGSPSMMPNSSSGSSTMAPSPSSPTSASNVSANSGQFVTQIQSDQIMASKLIGTKVVSANNESIGDINDVIVDRGGQAVAAVVGVGGFLGIGEKDVAIPFKSLEFANRDQVNAMNGNNSNNAAGNNVATTGSTNTTGPAGAGMSGTSANSGSSATASNNNANSGAASSSNSNTPERVVLRMTKEELQSAPTFNTRPQ
jgi:sporulation protein YlmC with PRC-barrel domain